MTDTRQRKDFRRGAESDRLQNARTSSLIHFDAVRNLGLQTSDTERADRLREVVRTLYEVNLRVPVIVEGKRDSAALRRLGLAGTIIPLHGGTGIYEFCEDILERYERVILLTDWDTKGEELFRTLSGHLKGIWEEFSPLRDILRVLCQKDTKDIEGIPPLFERLAGAGYRPIEEDDGTPDAEERDRETLR